MRIGTHGPGVLAMFVSLHNGFMGLIRDMKRRRKR
jgi:hypothetical protein